MVGPTRLQSELLPDMELPIVTVIITYPGAGPSDVAAKLSAPVAQALLDGIPDADIGTVTRVFQHMTERLDHVDLEAVSRSPSG